MNKKAKTKSLIFFSGVVFHLVFGVFCVFAGTGNIDVMSDGSKYSWGENIGWFNWSSAYSGVTVSTGYLSGYVWQENVGWICLGSGPENSTAYSNASSTDYGVNRDQSTGELSGYAWGENIGWINFSPVYGGVRISTAGIFEGWAWAENVGWLCFSSDTYRVRTNAMPPSPTNLSATALGVSSVSWSWSDNSSGWAQEQGFNIWNADETGLLIGAAGHAGQNATSWVETGLSPNTVYTRLVTAFNSGGEALSSYPVDAYTLANVPLRLAFSGVWLSSITLTWDGNGNPNTTTYEVYRSLDGIDFQMLMPSEITGFTDNELSTSTTYWYKVRAVNSAYPGVPTAFSNTINTVTPGYPVPHIVGTVPVDKAPAVLIGIRHIDIEFSEQVFPHDNLALSNNNIKFKASDGTDYSSLLTSFSNIGGNVYSISFDFDLSTGTTYIVEVSSFMSMSSETMMLFKTFSFTTEGDARFAPPAAPSDLAGTEPTQNSITWVWKDNAGNESQYLVLTDTVALTKDNQLLGAPHQFGILPEFSRNQIIATLSADSQSWKEEGLGLNTNYTRRVIAVNDIGATISPQASCYTLTNLPADFASGNLKFDSVDLSWSANGNLPATKYQLLRSTDAVRFIVISATELLSYSDTGLRQSSTYYYHLYSVNGDGVLTGPLKLIVNTPASEIRGPISGMVTQANGQPITGVLVQLLRAPNDVIAGETFTDTDGLYNFKDLEPGMYTVVAKWLINDIESMVYKKDIPQNSADILFTLEIQYQLAELSGKISLGTRANFAGRFAPGLQPYVELLQRSKVVAKVNADASGAYAVPNLLPGSYVIRAYNGVQMSEPSEVVVKEGAKLALNFKWALGFSRTGAYAYPNPARGGNLTLRYSLSPVGMLNHEAKIRIFNIAGELVREVSDDEIDKTGASVCRFVWDLKNDNGREVASGVYIYILDIKETVDPFEKVSVKNKLTVIK